MGSTLSRLATAGARVWPLKTSGWQKMFMRRASELMAESSSIQRQSLRARERREAVWGLARRRSQAGLAQMARSDGGVKVAVAALFVAAEDDDGGVVGAGGDVVEELLTRGRTVGSGA